MLSILIPNGETAGACFIKDDEYEFKLDNCDFMSRPLGSRGPWERRRMLSVREIQRHAASETETCCECEDILYVPEPPKWPDGSSMAFDARECSGYYLVTQREEIVTAHFAVYFRSVNEVVADLMPRIERDELRGKWGSEDFAVWWDGRLVAAIHQRMNSYMRDVSLFRDERNDSRGIPARFLPGWPTYEQWVESGKGPLWYDPANDENPAL